MQGQLRGEGGTSDMQSNHREEEKTAYQRTLGRTELGKKSFVFTGEGSGPRWGFRPNKLRAWAVEV